MRYRSQKSDTHSAIGLAYWNKYHTVDSGRMYYYSGDFHIVTSCFVECCIVTKTILKATKQF